MSEKMVGKGRTNLENYVQFWKMSENMFGKCHIFLENCGTFWKMYEQMVGKCRKKLQTVPFPHFLYFASLAATPPSVWKGMIAFPSDPFLKEN